MAKKKACKGKALVPSSGCNGDCSQCDEETALKRLLSGGPAGLEKMLAGFGPYKRVMDKLNEACEDAQQLLPSIPVVVFYGKMGEIERIKGSAQHINTVAAKLLGAIKDHPTVPQEAKATALEALVLLGKLDKQLE